MRCKHGVLSVECFIMFCDFEKVFGLTLDSASHSRVHGVPDDHLIVLFAVLVYSGVA